MFDGAMLDVAIGLILVFLVASLVASAIVEAVGGFLHRRSKHLWDTLDLLLGNTASTGDGSTVAADRADVMSIVEQLYRQPFITGLVRPTDRLRFDPATDTDGSRAPIAPSKLPKRAQQRRNAKNLPFGATGQVSEEALRRRFYGPNHIDAREFTSALLSYLRPDGTIDQVREALAALEAAAPLDSNVDVAADSVGDAILELGRAAETLKSKELAAAVARLRAAGETIDVDTVRAAVDDIRTVVHDLLTGTVTPAQFEAMLDVVPQDLRVKLLAVAGRVGRQFDDLRSGVEDWYDRNMAAASAWYRKQTRWFVFIAGLVIAVSLNVDAVHAGTTLYRDESVREAVVATAAGVGGVDCPTITTESGTKALELACVRDEIGGSLTLPVGWSDVDTSAGAWALRVLGWLVIALAVTLGAPFWFDLLRRALAHRRPTAAT